jgi:hypothetical protein
MRPTASARGPLLRRRPDHQPVARPAERGLVRVHGVEPGAPRVLLAAGEPYEVHLGLGDAGERRTRHLGAHGVRVAHVDDVAGRGDAARGEEREAHGLAVVGHLEARVEPRRVDGARVDAQAAAHEPRRGQRVPHGPARGGLHELVLTLEVLRREQHPREPVHRLQRGRAVQVRPAGARRRGERVAGGVVRGGVRVPAVAERARAPGALGRVRGGVAVRRLAEGEVVVHAGG